MGIFGAPTILSGQDISTFMDEVYETTRGEFQDEMTREEVDAAITEDFLNQQAGAEIDPLQVQDVCVDHNPAFFNTMLANIYVDTELPRLESLLVPRTHNLLSTLDNKAALAVH
jgi:hypothetical protein